MEKLLSTKEVAEFLGVNEKMIYTLINEKGLPATRITGKWLFPRHLVEQWVEMKTINYPRHMESAVQIPNLLLVAGSNDLLLERTLPLFRRQNPDFVALFGNLGSLGGLKALRQGLCHIATSHLAQENEEEYNFSFAASELEELPAVVNFCRREQGLLIPKGNPRGIRELTDIGRQDLRVANRPLEASTRLLFDRELKKAGLDCRRVKGYEREFQSHVDVGLEVLSGRADIAPGIRSVATLLDLDFLPLKWERFDLLIPKDGFFAKGIQLFLDLLHGADFHTLAEKLSGYDLSLSGKMLYPQNP
ncbi:MAG: helix-turn-helix transcriptional regulator [Desulfuromonadales bacterium]|jgi:putative molybdopterin biosynthesis protein